MSESLRSTDLSRLACEMRPTRRGGTNITKRGPSAAYHAVGNVVHSRDEGVVRVGRGTRVGLLRDVVRERRCGTKLPHELQHVHDDLSICFGGLVRRSSTRGKIEGRTEFLAEEVGVQRRGSEGIARRDVLETKNVSTQD